MIDFILEDHGSVAVLTPKTQAAEVWIGEHIPDDAQRWFEGVVIEPRYVGAILCGIASDGLEVG